MGRISDWLMGLFKEGVPFPLVRSRKLGRGDWVLTLLVLSFVFTVVVTLFCVAKGQDAPASPGVLTAAFLSAYVGKKWAPSLTEVIQTPPTKPTKDQVDGEV